MTDLLVLSHLVADVIIPTVSLPLVAGGHTTAEGIFTEPGGACTSLIAARRLGLDTGFLGIAGDDRYGHEAMEILAGEGVDTTLAVMAPEQTTCLCIVVTDEQGQHVFLEIPGRGPQLPCPTRWQGALRASKAMLTFGTALRKMLIPATLIDLMRGCRQNQTTVFFDPTFSIHWIDRDVLNRAVAATDVLLLTIEEARYVAAGADPFEIGRQLLALGPQVVVLKAGPEGCYVVSTDQEFHQPALPVTTVDTVGAGDSFDAAFIVGWVRGGDLRACAELANAMGAAVVQVSGAGRRVPSIERVLGLLHGRPVSRLAVNGRPTS